LSPLQRHRPGFSIIEVVSLLAVLAVLVSVAIPSFQRYSRRARSCEALLNIERIWNHAVAYHAAEQTDVAGNRLPRVLPLSAPLTPSSTPLMEPYESTGSDWSHPSWRALGFAITATHYYQYMFTQLDRNGAVPPRGGWQAEGPWTEPGAPLSSDGAFGVPSPLADSGSAEAPIGSMGTGFACGAAGDLDGDGTFAFYYRVGIIDATLQIRNGAGVFQENPLE
jgi:type II secretory pathway pseudopilin PulG